MTVANEVNKSGPYTGNGVTTVFDYEFRILDDAHIRVIRTEAGTATDLILNSDYTVAGVGDAGGGSITMASAPTAAQAITILRNVPFTQETDLENQGPYFAETVEAAFDLAAMRDQQLDERANRAIHFPDGEPELDSVLPPLDTRKNKLLGFDNAGLPVSVLAPSYVSDVYIGAAVVASRLDASLTIFDATTNFIITGGLTAAGDGGGAQYVRGAGTGSFVDGGGVSWKPTQLSGAVAVESRAVAAAVTFSASVNFVITGGLATAGDGLGATYARGVGSGSFVDAGGVSWKLISTAAQLSGSALVESRAVAAVTTFPDTTNFIITGGLAAAGDGGGAQYARGTGTGSFVDGGGVSWKPASDKARPAFGPVAAPWPVFIGDSLFTNAHASPALPNLIATAMGWASLDTIGVSGATIADQAQIYGFQKVPSLVNPALVWLGTNDVNLDADNRTTEQTSLEGLRALLCHLAIPTAKRVTGQAMTVAAGVWSNLGASIDPNGTFSTSAGAVKRAVVTGRHVVVAGWANLSCNGIGAVTIGNNGGASSSLVNETLTFKRPAILTNSPGGSPTQVIPFVRIYKNVGASFDSKLTVSVANTSVGGVGNEVFFSYVAGLSGLADEAMPLVMSFNLHHYTAAAETAHSTNAARRDRFNTGISNIVDELNGLGLWVVPVDAKSVLWDTTLLDTDGLHPINSGNAALTTAAVAAINTATGFWQTRLAAMSNSGFSDTVGSDLYPRGRFVIENFRRQIKPRASIGSGFSAHNNGGNTVAASGVVVPIPFGTELYDVAGDFASSVWTPGAGQVTLTAAITYSVTVTTQRYEVWITKNGANYKRLQAALASGTGELQVSGTLNDLAAEGDFYGVIAFHLAGSNATVDGSANKTYFTGMSAY